MDPPWIYPRGRAVVDRHGDWVRAPPPVAGPTSVAPSLPTPDPGYNPILPIGGEKERVPRRSLADQPYGVPRGAPAVAAAVAAR